MLRVIRARTLAKEIMPAAVRAMPAAVKAMLLAVRTLTIIGPRHVR